MDRGREDLGGEKRANILQTPKRQSKRKDNKPSPRQRQQLLQSNAIPDDAVSARNDGKSLGACPAHASATDDGALCVSDDLLRSTRAILSVYSSRGSPRRRPMITEKVCSASLPGDEIVSNTGVSADVVDSGLESGDIVIKEQEKEYWDVNDGWHLNSDEYTPVNVPTRSAPTKHSFRCVCERNWCRKVGTERWKMLHEPPVLTKVCQHVYREKLRSVLNFKKTRLTSVHLLVKLHHYPIEHRHLGLQRGDQQFRLDDEYVLPSMTADQIRAEIITAGEIRSLNRELYNKSIEHHLLGRGDGTMTQALLEDCLSNLRVNKDWQLGDKQSMSMTAKEMIVAAKKNGSGLIDMVLQSMNDNEKVTIPRNIEEKEYLRHYLPKERDMEKDQKKIDAKDGVTSRIPHSIVSRRKASRPPKKMSKKDVFLKLPTTARRIMNCLVPLNEHAPGTSKKQYAEKDYKIIGKTLVKGAESQCISVEDITLLKCYDERRSMNIYVDVNGSMPSLVGDQSSSKNWNHAHYCLVREVLTYDQVCFLLNFIESRNWEWLGATLIIYCRMKGKLAIEEREMEQMEEDIEALSEDPKMMEQVKEFELFFERLAECMIERRTMLELGDLTRLSWGHWNHWRTHLENYLFNKGEQDKREASRTSRGQVECERQRRINMFEAYVSTLLHTQGMHDRLACRLYTQVATDIPNNEAELELMTCNSFYDLYFTMTDYIFHDYGQGSLRAEAELAKMLLLPLFANEGDPLELGVEYLGLYQFKAKKWYLVQNEMLRVNGGDNPVCRATGHDRHVHTFARFFNPYGKRNLHKFTRMLCQVIDDWVRWNFNEFVGELEQCLQSKEGSRKSTFAVSVLRDLVQEYPEYTSIVMSLVKEWQWTLIMSQTVTEQS